MVRTALYACLSLYLFTGHLANAQDTSKIHIGGVVSPVYSGVKQLAGWDHEYSANLGFVGGVELQGAVSKHSAFSLELGYSQVSYKVNYAFIATDPNDPFIPDSANVNAGYLSIPLFYNFRYPLGKRWTVYARIGQGISFLINEKDEHTFLDGNTRKSGYLGKTLLYSNFGIGGIFRVEEDLAIKVEPRYSFYKDAFDNQMHPNPFQVSVYLGLLYIIR